MSRRDWTAEEVEEMRREMSRADWLINTGRPYSECVELGSEHDWTPLSFVFETQSLDPQGRVRARQPDLHKGRVYCVCVTCHSHTYIETAWVGYYLPSAEDPDA